MERRRMRKQLSCLPCRERKVKCDKGRPCAPCARSKAGHICLHPDRAGSNTLSSTHVQDHTVTNTPGRSSRGNSQAVLGGESIEAFSQSPVVHGHSPASAPGAPEGNDLAFQPLPSWLPMTSGDHDSPAFPGRSSIRWLMPKVSQLPSILRHRLSSADHNQFDSIMQCVHKAGFEMSENVFVTYSEQKHRLNQYRALELADPLDSPDQITKELPTREIADQFFTQYLETFGTVLPVFTQDTLDAYYRGFWRLPTASPLVQVIILLLVISLGNCTISTSGGRFSKAKVLHWWRLALAWEHSFVEVNKPTLLAIQVHCLIALVRQTYSFSESSGGIVNGVLTRSAVAIGLHLDPEQTGNSPHHAALHDHLRQLWFTILEIDLQCSLDDGTLPSFRSEDWTTRFPSANGSLSEIHQTISTRLDIAFFLNKPRWRADFHEVLRMNTEMFEIRRRLNLARSTQREGSLSKDFGEEYHDLICRRSILALHLPFGIVNDPRYAHSHNICLDTALLITSHTRQDEDASALTTLVQNPGATFRTILFHAVLYLCHILLRTSPREHSCDIEGNVRPETQDRIVQALEHFVKMTEDRLRAQDYGGKAFLFASLTLIYLQLVHGGTASNEQEFREKFRASVQEATKRAFCLFFNRENNPPLGPDG